MIDQLKPLIGKLCSFSQKRLGFSHPPKLFLKNDSLNSQKPLGKTAYYDPNDKSVTLFVHGRHPKDILRSFAHELVHHSQNLRGDLTPDKCGNMGDNYAQDNQHMRNMEKEAYLKGNMCLRDWEDSLSDEDKKTYKLTESIFIKENKKVNANKLKQLIREVVKNKLTEAPNQSTAPMPFQTGMVSPRTVKDRATAEEFLASSKAKELKGTRNQRFLDRAQAFIDADIADKAAVKKNEADRAAAAAAAKKNNPYENDFDKFMQDVNILNSLATMIPGDPKGKTQWYANPANKSAISQMSQVHAKLKSQDTSLINKNYGGATMKKGALDSYIRPYLKKMGIQGTPLDDVPAPGPILPPDPPESAADDAIASIDPTADDALASSEPTLGPVSGGDSETPETPTTQTSQPAVAASGGASQVRKKKGQQNRIVRRGALKSIGIDNIKDLQQRLVDARYSEKAGASRDGALPNGRPFVDGDFGPTSQKAVRAMQADLGLGGNADGVIGRNTLRRIMASNIPNVQVFREGPDAERAMGQVSPIVQVQRQNIKPIDESIQNRNTKITKSFLEKTIRSLLRETIAINIEETQCSNRDDEELGENLGAMAGAYRAGSEVADKIKKSKPKVDKVVNKALSKVKKLGDPIDKKIKGAAKDVKNKFKKGADKINQKIQNLEEKDQDGSIGQRSVKAGADNNPEETKMDHLPAAALKKAAERRGKKSNPPKSEKNPSESKIRTPEQENTLYEQRFGSKNNKLFEKLVKEWTK